MSRQRGARSLASLVRLSKGKPFNITAPRHSYIYGNVNEPRDVCRSSVKSSLFFLTVAKTQILELPGIGLAGEGEQRLAKHRHLGGVRRAAVGP